MNVRKALLITTSERYVTIGLGLVTLPVMSRLLTPAEVGVWVISMSIGAALAAVREFCSYNYIIQKNTLEVEDIRTNFSVMAITTVGVSLTVAISGLLSATLFGQSEVASCLYIISVIFLVEMFVFLPVALHRRHLEFGKVSLINLTTGTVSAVVTIAFAAWGAGYLSYPFGWLVGTLAAAVVGVRLMPDVSLFGLSLKNWWATLSFGGYYGTNMLLYKAYESLQHLLIGRLVSIEAVGIFQRATSIVQLPDKALFGGVASLTLPAFSAQMREGGDVKEAYLRAIEYITGMLWPVLILVAVFADLLVRVLLGGQWLSAVPIIQILAVAYIFSFTAHLDYALMISMGALRDNLKRALIVVSSSVVVIGFAAQYGLTAIALAQCVLVPLETAVSYYFLQRHINITWWELLGAVRRSGIVTLFIALCALPLISVGYHHDLVGALLIGTVFCALWVGGLRVAKHPLLQELIRVWRWILARRTAT